MDKKSIRILILEDEEMLLKAIVTKLSSLNITPIPFSNAPEALKYLRSDQIKPDLIWLDYYLKGMNGLDFVKELKKDDNLSSIPIIVVSNSASTQKVDSMLNLGVKKYLLKADHRLEDIVNSIREILGS